MTAEAGFSSQAEVLIDTRTAADVVGASYMDRPEWVAVHPITKEMFCTLTNNTARGRGGPFGRKEPLGADAVNPRSPNLMGHIIRWSEADKDPSGDPLLRNPITGNVGCCARAPSGHAAAAPPRSCG